MAQSAPGKPAQVPNTVSKKRKEAPTKPTLAKKKHKPDSGTRLRDARTLSTQTMSKAFSNGALDVDAFVKAREYEIRALEQGLQRSKTALNRRAFQQVPKELRRRTASHNVKRVPKRLRERGKKEMTEDNTPTVTARRRKPTRHMRLRLDTVKRLRALGAKEKAEKKKSEDANASKGNLTDPTKKQSTTEPKTSVQARTPKAKKTALATPPLPKAKFRKRQVHKAWLPTHLFHAKRAHMTPPSAPLWRFAIPLTPTQKGYRPTHRASHERGAVAWDTSYMSTIGLAGRESSIDIVLRGLGVDASAASCAPNGLWRKGVRTLETFIYERESRALIGPATLIWCAQTPTDKQNDADVGKANRQMFIRVHPSAFYQTWEELVRLASVAKPSINVEDLRFEIGSIEIIGPGSTEAFLSALRPSALAEGIAEEIADGSAEKTWTATAGMTNPNMLPTGALLGFEVQDPRLHHPPRTIKLPTTQDEQCKLLNLVATWPVDKTQSTPDLFDHTARLRGSKLPSQKSINRRKSLSKPGEYPSALPSDPKIPVILYTSTPSKSNRREQGTWTLLAPWKAIQPIWYSIIYYPLSTGQQPRFGGLNEKRQIAFEAGQPWFPADFPATKVGWEWEVNERKKREESWSRKPKGKRVSFEKVDLGESDKGEVGSPWACDWEFLLNGPNQGNQTEVTAENPAATGTVTKPAVEKSATTTADADKDAAPCPQPPQMPEAFSQISTSQAQSLLNSSTTPAPNDVGGKILTVRISLVTRGVPQSCARIYRLPVESSKRQAWLALLPSNQPKTQSKQGKTGLPKLPKTTPPHIAQQRLAQSLLEPLRAGGDAYPVCPGPEDLIGFVTTGSFNLSEGQGTGVGGLLLEKVVESVRQSSSGEGRLCVVRNVGESIARLARWDVV